MPPGVGAADEMAEPTRNTTPMLAILAPPPKAFTENTRAAMYSSVRDAEPPKSSSKWLARHVEDPLAGSAHDREDALAQHAPPDRKHEEQPGEREHGAEADQHRLAGGQEVDRSGAAAPCPREEGEREGDVHQQSRHLLQPDARRRHREIDALLLQEAHVGGDAAYARAGVMRLTNEPASWAANVPKKGMRPGTAPSRPIVAAR